jgi:pimeloyl-ACP methyl ester carboxylesterase
MLSGHLVQTADLRMHYLQRGTGDPVVLIHGFPETSYSWRHQLAALSEHYAVFAPDTRGFGRTDKPGTRVTRQILAQDVINFMDALGIERAAIVGPRLGRYHRVQAGYRLAASSNSPRTTRHLVHGMAASCAAWLLVQGGALSGGVLRKVPSRIYRDCHHGQEFNDDAGAS